MQCEIDELKKELRRIWRRHSSPNSELSSNEIDDATIDEDLELRLVRLSPTTRSIAIDTGIRACPAKA